MQIMNHGNLGSKKGYQMKYNLIETLMGTLVIIVAIAFLIFGINTNKINTSERVIISAVFDDISGLKIGDNIKVSGINVGKIEDLKLINESFEAKVIMSIDKSMDLPEDSSARITSSSLLGGSHVEIMPGISEIILKENDVIFDTTSSVSFVDMLGKMMFSNK